MPTQANVLAIVIMPPPVNGASVINKLMIERMNFSDISTLVLNTVPSVASMQKNIFLWRIARALLILKLFARICFTYFNPPSHVYMSISGGNGLFFDCILAVALKTINRPLTIHHHSYNYVRSNKPLFKLLCKILTTTRVTHVVLCTDMGEKLCARYPKYIKPEQIHVVSNSAFFKKNKTGLIKRQNNKLRVGYISNITKEKGIYEALDLFAKYSDLTPEFTLTIAGPCQDEVILKKLIRMSEQDPRIEYLGAVYNQDKITFFEGIDVLVFPTRYYNEAEPLVIYEAAEQGVPTIAYAKGCIASMVSKCGGWSIDERDSFTKASIPILKLLSSKSNLEKHQALALNGSELLRGSSQGSLNELMAKIRGTL